MKWLAFIPVAALACVAPVRAQPALDRPVLGRMLDRDGVLRPVTGVAGSFQLDAPALTGVLATACNASLCVAKTKAAIVSGTMSAPAPPGPAIIALNGSSAWIYLSSTAQLARWQAGILTPDDLAIDGEVLSLRATPTGIELSVRRASGVWVVAADGTALDSLPSETIAVLLLPNAIVYAIGDALVLRKADGSEMRFAAPGVTKVFALGDGYVEALTPTSAFALRTVAGQEKLFQLPEAARPPRFESSLTR
jgi:hypothetical protein